MGKLLCDIGSSMTESFPPSVSPAPPLITWRDQIQDLPGQSKAVTTLPSATNTTTATTSWENIPGLDEQQKCNLAKLQSRGVLWKPRPPESNHLSPLVFRLSHGGDVDADGNCLFTASQRAMAVGEENPSLNARELRRRTVKRFLQDLGSANQEEKEIVELAIRHMYSPDLKCGWGIHVVQEVKLVANKGDRVSMDSAIDELINLGVMRENAAESIYKERCIAVEDGASWAKYMSISGSSNDDYDIITLQYTEDGLLSVDENRRGQAAAFGDDIAIECLATEFKSEIFVVQAHGSDAVVDEDNCVFFLPHHPRCPVSRHPFFLFMKGTGWCGAGGDHYEPLIAHSSSLVSSEKVAFVL